MAALPPPVADRVRASVENARSSSADGRWHSEGAQTLAECAKTSTRDGRAVSAAAAQDATIDEKPGWYEVKKSLRIVRFDGEDGVFERVLEPTVLDYLQGSGLEKFVRLPWVYAAREVTPPNYWDFIYNWDS